MQASENSMGFAVSMKDVKAPANITTDSPSAIKWWASIGMIWMVFAIATWVRWMLSDDFTPTQVGLDQIEPWRMTMFRIIEIVGITGSFWGLYQFVWKPYRTEGRLTITALVMLTMPFMWIQDPWLNYTVPIFSYSSGFYNWGNWLGQMPGLVAPNVEIMPEPFPFAFFAYFWLVGLPLVAIFWSMRKWKEWRPNAGVVQLLFVALIGGFIYDVIVEGGGAQLEVWSFGGFIQELSIFAGHHNQYPLYEGVLWGGVVGLWASVMYFKNDKGQMICERGVDKLSVSPRRKTFLRYLAILGIFQTIFLFGYNIPIQFFALHADPWPQDTPAHLMNNICGPGTNYTCPAPGVPFNRRGANGTYVAPDLSMNPGLSINKE